MKTYALLEQPDTLPPKQRLEQLLHSVLPLQRVVYARGITSETSPDDIRRLQIDTEWAVREALAFRLAQLANESPSQQTNKTITMDVITVLLRDSNADVRKAAIHCTGRLADSWGVMSLVPISLALTRDKDAIARATGAAVLGEMATRAQPVTMTWNIIWQELSCMALEDVRFQVRKAAVLSIPGCVVAGGLRNIPDATRTRIVEVLEKAATDPAWPVRNAVASALSHVGHELLCTVMITLVETDPSAHVKYTAQQSLGNFIGLVGPVGFAAALASVKPSTPSTTPIASRLVTHYLATLQSSATDESRFCSCFSFPGVVLALPKKWMDTLKPIHAKLAKDSSNKIRRCIAASLCELAAGLGESITRDDLCPIYVELLEDFDDDVRLKALEKLSAMMVYLSPEQRVNVLAHVEMLRKNACTSKSALARDMRCSIASQLVTMAKLRPPPPPMKLAEIFWACGNDEASNVRLAAMSAAGEIVSIFEGKGEATAFCTEVLSMAQSDKFQHRLLYVYCARALLACKAAQGALDVGTGPTGKPTNRARLEAALDVLKRDKVWNVQSEANR